MNQNNKQNLAQVIEKYVSGKMSRRSFLRHAATLGLVVGGAGILGGGVDMVKHIFGF